MSFHVNLGEAMSLLEVRVSRNVWELTCGDGACRDATSFSWLWCKVGVFLFGRQSEKCSGYFRPPSFSDYT